MLFKDHCNTYLAPVDDGTDAATTGEETTNEKTFTQAKLETILADHLAHQERNLRHADEL